MSLREIVKKYTFLIILCFTLLGGLLRFYNLNWGAPYYFHPDERNIAMSVTQLNFPKHMHPNFFAYGSLPIYTIYATGLGFQAITGEASNTENFLPFHIAILVSRFYSALLSTLLIPLIYIFGKVIHSKRAGILASFFTLMSVGFLQFAHFGTFEMWLTVPGVLLCLICVLLLKQKPLPLFIMAAVLCGILIAVKISSLVLFPLPLLALGLRYPVKPLLQKKRHVIRYFGIAILATLGLFIIAGIVYLVTNPYVLLAFENFKGSMNYESKVALGTLPVFYTQEFYTAVPILFQFTRIYPFLINPLLTILFFISLFYFIPVTFLQKNKAYWLILLCFSLLFFSQAFLFVKWVRYMVPTLPFVYLITAVGIIDFFRKKERVLNLQPVIFSMILITCCLHAFAYTHTVLIQPDTRITARSWVKTHLPARNEATSEIYDMGIIPFNEMFFHITLCNIYDMETNNYPCDGKTMKEQIAAATYYIVPSQRIFKTRFINPKKYPAGFAFYQSLFRGDLQYVKVYETPCDFFCHFLYLGKPAFAFEQTANVFDRPTIYIFQKQTDNTNGKNYEFPTANY